MPACGSRAAEQASAVLAPLVLPPPLSDLPWDVAQDAFGLEGTDFLGHFGRVLLRAAQDEKASHLRDPTGEPG
jgi:hypothetical protein